MVTGAGRCSRRSGCWSLADGVGVVRLGVEPPRLDEFPSRRGDSRATLAARCDRNRDPRENLMDPVAWRSSRRPWPS